MIQSTMRKIMYKNPYLKTLSEFYENLEKEKENPSNNCKETAIQLSSGYKNADITADTIEEYLVESSKLEAIFFGLKLKDWSYDIPVPKHFVHLGVLDPHNHQWSYHRLDNGLFYKTDNFIEEPTTEIKKRKHLYENTFAGRTNYTYLFDTELVFLKFKDTQYS